MRISDVEAYMEWKKDTSKPHPWFEFKPETGFRDSLMEVVKKCEAKQKTKEG